jgi:hypothetical protein
VEKTLNTWAVRMLKAELKVRETSYESLAKEMTARGFPISEMAVRSRMHRGALSAAFLLGVITALGMTEKEAADFFTRLYARLKATSSEVAPPVSG